MKYNRVNLLIWIALILLLTVFTDPASALATERLEVKVNPTYTTGSPVVIGIKLKDEAGQPVELANPQTVKINIKNPHGNMIQSVARKGNWNKPGEYYDVFTIDSIGKFEITVEESSSNLKTTVNFDSVFITSSSAIIIIIAVFMLLGSFIYWKKSVYKKVAKI